MISVDWRNKIIHIPRNDLILIQSSPTEIRELDLNTFRLTLKDLEDDENGGIPFVDTHRHVEPISVGGVTLARVVEIINGYTVTFEDGQYAVNLKGANTNVADVTNVNQVSVRSSNSAGLQDLSTLLAAAYQGEVYVKPSTGQAGTDTPIGTRTSPVNNLQDALTIAQSKGISKIILGETMTINQGDFSNGYLFMGDNAVATVITLDSGPDFTKCEFRNLTLQGVLDSSTVIRECNVLNLTAFDGFMWQCAITNEVTVRGGSQASIAQCFSNVAGGGPGQTPTVNLDGNGSLALRGYDGGLTIKNYSGGGAISMDYNSGRLIIDSTVTAGDIYVRGDCVITDNSTGTAVLHDGTLHYDMEVINRGVQKASILVPHTENTN